MRHPRLIPVLLLIIVTSLATPLQAQIVLKGKITTEKNEPVAFAPVILQQLPDTTRYTEGVITDMAGNYRFGKHRAGRYLLSVRTIGYKTLYDTVLLRKPSIGMTEVRPGLRPVRRCRRDRCGGRHGQQHGQLFRPDGIYHHQ